MYYHVRITTFSNRSHDEVKLDLSDEKLKEQFLAPYENNDIISINGKKIDRDDIERIRINRTKQKSLELLPIVRRERAASSINTPGISDEWYIANKGEEVTDDLIKIPRDYKESNTNADSNGSKPQRKQIFVVHGHDNEMKEAVARTLVKLGLDPIILHEQPNGGRTIIEKITDYAEKVSFAIVLLSPDDMGYKKDQKLESAKYRARQNVILELGYFIGKLGRQHVVALFRNVTDFELPTDFSGVLYISFDDSGRWQFDLVKELRVAGYDIDANKLVH
ncbi:MAG: nucleotide-binding protein [Tissierellia bacterium]|jgi:predicted nucleotide-binding protein|nr:nucleotide-binding protein [Tissierellia bacterium]